MPQAPPQELTPSEIQNLRRVSKGGAVSDVMYRRLKALGLIQKEFRGWSLTASGRSELAAADQGGISRSGGGER